MNLRIQMADLKYTKQPNAWNAFLKEFHRKAAPGSIGEGSASASAAWKTLGPEQREVYRLKGLAMTSGVISDRGAVQRIYGELIKRVGIIFS